MQSACSTTPPRAAPTPTPDDPPDRAKGYAHEVLGGHVGVVELFPVHEDFDPPEAVGAVAAQGDLREGRIGIGLSDEQVGPLLEELYRVPGAGRLDVRPCDHVDMRRDLVLAPVEAARLDDDRRQVRHRIGRRECRGEDHCVHVCLSPSCEGMCRFMDRPAFRL